MLVLLAVQLLGPDPVRPHAGRVHDVRGRDREALAGVALLAYDPRGAPLLLDQLDRARAVHAHRAEPLRLAQHREDEPRVVRLAVVEEIGRGGIARLERRHQLEHLGGVDRAMAVGAPVLATLERGLALRPAARARVAQRHHVVRVQPDADAQVQARALERGHQERERLHEVGREPHHQLPLQQRLAHEAEVEVLQVAQAAVDHLRGAAGGSAREVVALDEGNREPARRRVERHARAGDAASDDHDVELLALHHAERIRTRNHGVTVEVTRVLGVLRPKRYAPRCTGFGRVRPAAGASRRRLSPGRGA